MFLSAVALEARESICERIDSGAISAGEGYEELLGWIPDDLEALAELGRLRRLAGDLTAAEEYGWRAVMAHPCMAPAYMELARTLNCRPEARGLAEALCGIAVGLAGFDDAVLEKIEIDGGKHGEAEGYSDLSVPAKKRLVAMLLRCQDAGEAPGTERELRRLRLLAEMWSVGDLAPERVDAILAEGPEMIPLLVGVLRGWARELLGEEGDGAAENALGLIGELGSPAEIPVLCELVEMQDVNVSGAAKWAVGRIVERQPRESIAYFRQAIPGMDFSQRLLVCTQLLRDPELDADGSLLRLLSEGLDGWPQLEIDGFGVALSMAVAIRGGGRSAKCDSEVMHRLEGKLSPEVRRQSRALRDAVASGMPTPGCFAPMETSVYEICGGNAIWENDEVESEEVDEPVVPVAPVRRSAQPGRNDPCWCKSGKKYKKCHLEDDERARRGEAPPRLDAVIPGDLDGLRRRIGDFLAQVLPVRENRGMVAEFTGEGRDLAESETMALVDWLVHDYRAPKLGRSVIEEFLERNRGRLAKQEREMVAAWAKSCVSLWEVQEVTPGVGISVKNLLSGEAEFVHDVSLSAQLVRWDVMLMRVLPGERGMESTGSGIRVPRGAIDALRRWMGEEKERSGLSWTAYLKRDLPRIRRQPMVILEKQRKGLRLCNSDGDPLVIATARYGVLDEDLVRRALRKWRDLSEADGAGQYVWTSVQSTVLGQLRVKAGELVLECNSRERLERGKALLAEAAGKHLSHRGDSYAEAEEWKQRAAVAVEGPEGEQDELPPEIRDRVLAAYLEKHYDGWPDTKLPATMAKIGRAHV